jgi:hypothetical protein
MNFGEALDLLITEPYLTKKKVQIKREKWQDNEYIELIKNKTSKLLMKNSNKGYIAYIPDMVELVNAMDWEVIYNEY